MEWTLASFFFKGTTILSNFMAYIYVLYAHMMLAVFSVNLVLCITFNLQCIYFQCGMHITLTIGRLRQSAKMDRLSLLQHFTEGALYMIDKHVWMYMDII